MRISARADYAVRAAVELAAAGEGPTKGEAIARAQGIPLKFLENILGDLRHSGIVRSQRGADGGYWLARPADQITVADVIRAVEGPLASVRGGPPEDVAYAGAAESLSSVWIAVRASLRRLTSGNHALADDLAQETFLLAYRNLKSFRQEAKFSTWLYRIAYNAFLGDIRKTKELQLSDDEDADDVTTSDDTATPVARAVALSIDLQRAMAVLSDAERAAIVQCYHNDLSHEEAAFVLGCPVGTVKTHILRAKQKLKARLGAWAPEG